MLSPEVAQTLKNLLGQVATNDADSTALVLRCHQEIDASTEEGPNGDLPDALSA